jgi:hypothetical protein
MGQGTIPFLVPALAHLDEIKLSDLARHPCGSVTSKSHTAISKPSLRSFLAVSSCVWIDTAKRGL